MAGRGFYVNFKVPEIAQALKQIDRYDGKSRLKVEDAVSTSTKAIRKGAIKRIRSATGYLKKRTVSNFNKKDIVGTIRAKAPHAHLVEFGARAATVKPKKKKALKIPYRGLGVALNNYAAKADIPARRERPYMRPAFEDERPNLIKKLSRAVRKT